MPYYKNAFDFENSLIEVANSVLQSEGITRSQERIGGGASSWELDYIFIPTSANKAGGMYVFEFKYSPSPTLADSAINMQLARFAALQEANNQRSIRFLLVTNGHVSNAKVPRNVCIIDNIRDSNDWRSRLQSWLVSERSRPAWTEW